MYHHSPPSGLESGKASITDFYRPDEVKYHGKGNRGVVSMNFFGELFDCTKFRLLNFCFFSLVLRIRTLRRSEKIVCAANSNNILAQTGFLKI